MTKKDLARVVSERTGIPQTQAHEYVQQVLGTVLESLASERRVELRNFGTCYTAIGGSVVLMGTWHERDRGNEGFSMFELKAS